MKTNILRILQDKTELIISHPKNKYDLFPNGTINFDGQIIEVSSLVKSFGVFFDWSLNMDDQISFILYICLLSILIMCCSCTSSTYCMLSALV